MEYICQNRHCGKNVHIRRTFAKKYWTILNILLIFFGRQLTFILLPPNNVNVLVLLNKKTIQALCTEVNHSSVGFFFSG